MGKRLRADYKLAVDKAAEVIEDYRINRFPVVLEDIADALANEIALMTYSAFGRKNCVSIREIIRTMDSEFGFSLYNPGRNQFLICYNDTQIYTLCRFTIAHELGHILLGHHQSAGVGFISSSTIPGQEYREYEKEANAFGRNLLSPAPIARTVVAENSSHSEKIRRLMDSFFISRKAAVARLNLLNEDIWNCPDPFFKLCDRCCIVNYPFVCMDCGSMLPDGAKYCPFCGSRRRHRNQRFKKIPKAVPTDTFHSVRKCVNCGNEILSTGARFCRICGAPSMNLCVGRFFSENPEDRHVNEPYARYCTVCGAITAFFQRNMIGSEEDDMHDPVNYCDGVPYDENTKRIKICPQCGNAEFGDEAMYCRICGLDLYNRCEGEYCGNEIVEESRHKNPSNARFCETCGKPTSFLEKGILCEYTEYVPIEERPQMAPIPEEGIPWLHNNPDDDTAPFQDDIPASVFTAVDPSELPF